VVSIHADGEQLDPGGNVMDVTLDAPFRNVDKPFTIKAP
jgi:hypothetical protein